MNAGTHTPPDSDRPVPDAGDSRTVPVHLRERTIELIERATSHVYGPHPDSPAGLALAAVQQDIAHAYYAAVAAEAAALRTAHDDDRSFVDTDGTTYPIDFSESARDKRRGLDVRSGDEGSSL